jgi:pilus assembly protein CpaE
LDVVADTRGHALHLASGYSRPHIAKGGVGTTALAVHVAISLVSKHGKKTLLVDHHHQIKQSQHHFDELIRNVQQLAPDLLKGSL